jgi:predicted nucleotidyltransferase component of viral defense system
VIRKQDILDRSAEWGLRSDVVEKDYALGWLLAAIARHPETSRLWVFKGGTCLKKCFIETYRFSEDLDFSLLPDAAYSAEGLLTILRELARNATEMSGIEFAEAEISVRERQDKQGRPTFQGRVGYRGPLAFPGWPRLLLDLTRHEPVVGVVDRRPIFHPYPDALPDGTEVSTYSLEELLAEKTRALWERTRPRDAYDVVFLLDNHAADLDLDQAREFFALKCRAKDFEPPASADLASRVRDDAELQAEWANMLAHQLPQLAPADGIIARITGGLLEWLDRLPPAPRIRLQPVAASAGGMPLAAPAVRFWGTDAGPGLERIRFAGANRLYVEFDYNQKHRVVEPYSLRRARAGNVLLYAWELAAGHIKAFDLGKIANLRVGSTSFSPRYAIDLGLIAPVAERRHSGSPRAGRPRGGPRRRSRGISHVYQCVVCGRRFRHSRFDSSLGPHKDKQGYPCAGRVGIFVRSVY